MVIGPYENEPMHTHRLPSVMFGSDLHGTLAFDIEYYRYDYDAAGRKYVVTDSFRQHRPAVPPGARDTGRFMQPEPPHSIRNLSPVTIRAYRVEFKNRE